ncbi:sigma-54 interaction domain-containing protein [Acetonema longum]|nr:sigma 54-interacting transcriptional regulator [Acetonema longum]
MKKAEVCFIGRNEAVCRLPAQQLSRFLGQYINVKEWSLNNLDDLTGVVDSDVYITSSKVVYNVVKPHLPERKTIFIADRTINTEHLDHLLELDPTTKAIFATHSKETALMGIEMVKNFGIHHITMYPYYPGCQMELSSEINTVIITGSRNLVPPSIRTVIDLGAKGLDISTFAQLIHHLHLPLQILNKISNQYIHDIMAITVKRQQIASLNSALLNTVTQAIIAVDTEEEVTLLNPAAAKLLQLQEKEVIGQKMTRIAPEIDLRSVIRERQLLRHDFKQIGSSHYILDANPIIDTTGFVSGAVATIRPVSEVQELETKVRRELRLSGNLAKYSFSDIIGESPELKNAIQLATHFAKTESTILLEGESGTGKEMFAQAIHNLSPRKHGGFVAINFAALPENLIESELFGYDEGAFTGAKKGGKPGLFEEAHKGTIFLDEIGDASLEVQKRLLRVLEEREVRRVGGRAVTPVDVRVVAATNKNLVQLVESGKFRGDLYYRLCTLPINIPSLAARGGDIIKLIDFFSRKSYGYPLRLHSELSAFLQRYSWPGNIRELQNIVIYLYNVVGWNEASIEHLPSYITGKGPKAPVAFSDVQIEKDTDGFVHELEMQNVRKEVAAILAEIKSACAVEKKGLGRNALLKRLELLNLGWSEYKVRHWLKILIKNGYLIAGATKQGNKVTEKGNELLQSLDSWKHRDV